MRSLFHKIGFSLFAAVSLGAASESFAEVRFNRDVRPILSDRCFNCHGPDKGTRKAKLRLDQQESAFAGREEGKAAIVPGKLEQSLLIERIFSDDPDEIMPPRDSHLTLSETEKKTLKEWVAQGAKYEPHWAFIPPARDIPLPEVKNKNWAKNEIDHFVLSRLEQEGVVPSPEADKLRWLRRVSYDLNGLPPTPDEMEEFISDSSTEAYEKVVDRLLKSPRFGERMAVPWLDWSRYADSYGYQSDQLSPTWPFRDWVINAFNRNLPYDQFLTEQLAGDLLPGAEVQQRLATAFNRLHRMTNEGGSVEEEWRTEYVADRAQTFGSVYLALTVECARCHDHKFDPFTQKDFYSLSAFFNSIDEYGLYNGTSHVPTPSVLLPTPEQEKAMKETSEARAKAAAEMQAVEKKAQEEIRTWDKQVPFGQEQKGLIAHFNFDQLNDGKAENQAAKTNQASLGANSVAKGKWGNALKFTGDDLFKVSGVMPSLSASDSYSILFSLWIPEGLTNGVVFHCTEGTDVGFHGSELSLQDGKLMFVIKRFWPGNAIAIETTETIPQGSWTHIGLTYNGSGDAHGMELFLDGNLAKTSIYRNNLYKGPQNNDSGFSFGARFRSSGLKDALLDNLQIFNRPLAHLEVEHHWNGAPLKDLIQNAKGEQLRNFYLAVVSEEAAKARTELATATRKFLEVRNPVQETSVMEEMKEARPAYLLARGQYDAPKNDETKVPRSTPSFLPELPTDAPRDRLGLAKWATHPDHPLTARVAVNRFWEMLFGRGLVYSSDNFGAQGAMPSHPELLDWLARDFVQNGWNTKALLKKMVLSATYRQDSTRRPDLADKDPENILVARGPSHRLSAEMVRDTALFASGLLTEKIGGPPASPYMPGDLWRESNSMSPAYRESIGEDLYRRSVYTVVKRTAPMPNMAAFDAPSREACTMKRSATITPQQAFVLLNDQQFVEAARVLAEKMLKAAPESDEQKIVVAFRRLAGRDPNDREAQLLVELFSEQRKLYTDSPERAAKLLEVGKKKADPSLKPVELAAATAVAQAIMNLDAAIWKR